MDCEKHFTHFHHDCHLFGICTVIFITSKSHEKTNLHKVLSYVSISIIFVSRIVFVKSIYKLKFCNLPSKYRTLNLDCSFKKHQLYLISTTCGQFAKNSS